MSNPSERVAALVHCLGADATENKCGTVKEIAPEQFEWQLADEELENVRIRVHHVACHMTHEYTYLPPDADVRIQIRVIDPRSFPRQEVYLSDYFKVFKSAGRGITV